MVAVMPILARSPSIPSIILNALVNPITIIVNGDKIPNSKS